jgi:hypothetical protein
LAGPKAAAHFLLVAQCRMTTFGPLLALLKESLNVGFR